MVEMEDMQNRVVNTPPVEEEEGANSSFSEATDNDNLMDEELRELREAEASGSREAMEEEIGDLLFTVANISRFHGIDPEAALRGTIDKFVRRFAHIEKHFPAAQGDLKAMDALWEETKEKEKRGR